MAEVDISKVWRRGLLVSANKMSTTNEPHRHAVDRYTSAGATTDGLTFSFRVSYFLVFCVLFRLDGE